MNTSPLRRLLLRRVCSCQLLPRLSISTRASSTSTEAIKHSPAYPYSVTRNAEDLKRRWQPLAPSVQREQAQRAYAFRRMRWSALGIFACSICMLGAIYAYAGELPEVQEMRKKKRLSKKTETSFDAPPALNLALDTSTAVAEAEIEQIPTGTSTIPFFPKTIHISSSTTDRLGHEEYHLLGLGIRTVSFLNIQVYVVGLYIALPDIALLQERLIRRLSPIATTLVANEKDELRSLLLDPTHGEEAWNTILHDPGIRTAIRIVPTRNTDFMHLRDGWVRGITTRTQQYATTKTAESFTDDSFGQSLNSFKSIWTGGGRVPKGETLLLTRDDVGKMAAWYEDKQKGAKVRLGEIEDERISRLIWLGYLAGKNVSSESARQSIVDGCVEVVGRPVGTVEGQVV